ncbi:hypothetical protein [Dehalobacterium formicoaceticum]|uniref:hypothetical protein n=1 Tax=Dehalobacterium formicoaceticum TaxID=51515 RepID=UPI000B7F2534|nr:hypothetical protein [Dehalobacterium formicoaceticum]
MKKITKFTGYVSIMLTICLLLGATSVLAGGSFDGLTKKEINKKLMDDMMKESEGVNIYDFDEGELKVQEIAKKTGFHRNQVTGLLGKGYTEEEIYAMDLDKVDDILTEGLGDDEKLMYYTHVAPRPFNEYVDRFPEGYFSEQGLARGLVYCSICGYSHSNLVN